MSYTIGEVARRSGMTVEGLRFYERRGLLQPARRTAAGYRIYEEAQLESLRFIRAAQQMGFSLGEIEELLQLRAGGAGTCSEVRARLRAKLAAVNERRRLLAIFAGQLRGAIGQCDTQLEGGSGNCCPVLDELGAGLLPPEGKPASR